MDFFCGTPLRTPPPPEDGEVLDPQGPSPREGMGSPPKKRQGPANVCLLAPDVVDDLYTEFCFRRRSDVGMRIISLAPISQGRSGRPESKGLRSPPLFTQGPTKRSSRLRVIQFGLAPDGVFLAASSRKPDVSSYLAFSPLPRCRGGLFSAALSVPAQRKDGPSVLRSIVLNGARTFLPGLRGPERSSGRR